MSKPRHSSVIIILILFILTSCKSDLPVDYINPFICTEGDHGQWLPAALAPFGLIELCPDTWPGSLTADGDFAHSGYDYSDKYIRGFSHLHRGSSGGTTIHDRAGLLSFVPFSGIPADTFFYNPVLRIDKSTEKAQAGYYSVNLPEDSIIVELTATVHSGIHRYTFKGSGSNEIFIYEGNRGGAAGISCRHEHMLMVVADAYFKGLMRIDINTVYPYMRKEVILQMPEKYDSIGFIPARPDQTGEYCWDNWTLAQVAKTIGNVKDYDYLLKRSEYWRNTWDPDILFFRARNADGTWLDFPEDPSINREKYTYEGSKWHWRWNIIHDVPCQIEVFGGKEKFINELQYFFDNDLYTAGNQIDLQAPFLFNMAGAPWLTQKWVRKILKEPIVQKYGTHGFFKKPVFDRVYKTTPDGYLEEMDDDYGCMAAWYAMSAMGIYQVCPGNPAYQVTAPIFGKVTINLDNSFYRGKKFIIRAVNLNDKNIYIQSATLNGIPFKQSWISHEDIVKGGELVFQMGNKPNTNWGI